MSQVFLTPGEQRKITNNKYFNVPKDNEMTPKQLRKILESNPEGSRVVFLNYFFGQVNNKGPEVCQLLEDEYNADIVPFLSPEIKAMHDRTLANLKEPGPDVMATNFKNGMYTVVLLNVGTEETPVFVKYPKLVINVLTGRYIVKNAHDSTAPKRVVLNIPNENRHVTKFRPFMSSQEGVIPDLDNEDFFACVELTQKDFAFCMRILAAAYKKDSENVRLQCAEGISAKILKSIRLNETSPAALAKKVKTVAKRGADGKMEFEQMELTEASKFYTQIRMGISGQTDAKFWDEYLKKVKHNFKANNQIVVAPRSYVYYRYVDTSLIGKAENSIIDLPSIMTLNKADAYKEQKDADHTVYAYNFRDSGFVGNKHPMYSEFAESYNQVLNAVVSLNLFINSINFSPSFEIVPNRHLFMLRLDNSAFEQGVAVTDDGMIDIDSDKTFIPLKVTETKQSPGDGVVDIDDEDSTDIK